MVFVVDIRVDGEKHRVIVNSEGDWECLTCACVSKHKFAFEKAKNKTEYPKIRKKNREGKDGL